MMNIHVDSGGARTLAPLLLLKWNTIDNPSLKYVFELFTAKTLLNKS